MSSESDKNRPTDKALSSLLDLCEDICRRNYIKELTCTGSPDSSNLTMHRWFANTQCPGSFLVSYYSTIVSVVNKRLKTTRKASSTTEQLKAASTIALGAINPYMVTVDDYDGEINYNDLKEFGVVGVMFRAGSYYDVNHEKNLRYVNSKLKAQMTHLNGVLPHALYAVVRARTVQEAKLECNELYLVISKYPPKLGLWLKLELSCSAKVAKDIVDTYYNYIYKWGLKDKCGFYCTRQQANLIGWTGYTDKFSLWLIETSSSVRNLDELLTPTFFKL